MMPWTGFRRSLGAARAIHRCYIVHPVKPHCRSASPIWEEVEVAMAEEELLLTLEAQRERERECVCVCVRVKDIPEGLRASGLRSDEVRLRMQVISRSVQSLPAPSGTIR